MKHSLLKMLVCPMCQVELSLTVDVQIGEEIKAGSLSCGQCSNVYPIRNGVPRFVPTDDYVGNFSFEWNVHRKTQVDSSQCKRPEYYAEREPVVYGRSDQRSEHTFF